MILEMNLPRISSMCYVKDPSFAPMWFYYNRPIQMTLPSSCPESGGPSAAGRTGTGFGKHARCLYAGHSTTCLQPHLSNRSHFGNAKGRVTGMTGLQLVGNVPYFACTGEIDTPTDRGRSKFGEETIQKNPSLVDWLKNRASESRRVGSICTGAFVLARRACSMRANVIKT